MCVTPDGHHRHRHDWDLANPTRADDLAAIVAADQVRLVLRPDSVRRYAF